MGHAMEGGVMHVDDMCSNDVAGVRHRASELLLRCMPKLAFVLRCR